MSSKRKLTQSVTASATKLKLDSINKILKIDSAKKRKDKLSKQITKVALAQLLKDTPDAFSRKLPDFKIFLDRKENVELFREFLKTQYCQENLEFYLACEKYQQLDHSGGGDMLIKFNARQIFNDFLGENAKQPVNVNADCITTIERNLNQPNPHLFRDAQQEIFNLMRSDCYPRFCKTWEIDENTAQKILQVTQRPTQQSLDEVDAPSHNRSHLNTTTVSSRSNCTYHTRSSTSARVATTRKLQNLSNVSNPCPSNCPYLRLGLPCQSHNLNTSETSTYSREQSKDLIDSISLSKIHHIPQRRPAKTPPPPPLPPKPQAGMRDLAAPSLEKPSSFVGKVFHV